MSVPSAAQVRRRTVLHHICIGAAVVAAGASAAAIQAAGGTAQASAAADDGGDVAAAEQAMPEGRTEIRRVVVTPLDELEPDHEPIDALAVALAARFDLVATAPEPEPAPAADGGSATITTTHVPLATWEAVARCESGYGGEPDWSINTGNGYYGGLQFALSSWEWVGGSGYPHEASKATQIEMAERLWELQGWNAWPACSRQLGLR